MTDSNDPTAWARRDMAAKEANRPVRETRAVKVLYSFYNGAFGHEAGDVCALPPPVAQHLVDIGVCSYDLKAPLPDSDLSLAQRKAMTTQAVAGDVMVRIKKPIGLYQPGDVTGFNEGTVRLMVERGIAERVERPKVVLKTLASLKAALIGK